MDTKKLSFGEVKEKIGEHLKTALDVQDFSISYAKLTEGEWRVSVEFKEDISGIKFPTSALFSLDAVTGEVKQYKKGYTWSF